MKEMSDPNPHGFAFRIGLAPWICRSYHTLLFLWEEKDIHKVLMHALPHAAVPDGEGFHEVPCVVQALPHSALSVGGEGYP